MDEIVAEVTEGEVTIVVDGVELVQFPNDQEISLQIETGHSNETGNEEDDPIKLPEEPLKRSRKGCISGYSVFVSEYLKRSQGNKSESNGSIFRRAAETWKSMTADEKFTYEERARDVSTNRPRPAAATHKFICEMCGYQFSRNNLFTYHKKHCGQLLPCTRCPKKFKTKSELTRHLTFVHDKVRRFACKQCGRAFGAKGHLQTHLQIHTGEKPFQCIYCDASFRTKSNRTRHQEKMHGRIKQEDLEFQEVEMKNAVPMEPENETQIEIIVGS